MSEAEIKFVKLDSPEWERVFLPHVMNLDIDEIETWGILERQNDSLKPVLYVNAVLEMCGFTEAEFRVFVYLAVRPAVEMKTIADQLGISPETLNTQWDSIRRKLNKEGISTDREALRYLVVFRFENPSENTP